MAKRVNEFTLELEDNEKEEPTLEEKFQEAIVVEPNEISRKYEEYKKAEAEFNAVYEPLKKNLLDLYATDPDAEKYAKSVIVGGLKLTYVAPTTRKSVDTKKLKEELPDIAKKFTKTSNISATLRMSETHTYDIELES